MFEATLYSNSCCVIRYAKSLCMFNHLYRLSSYWVNVTPELTKPAAPAVVPKIGRDEQPDERDNEIVIELDPENQYGRTQPRANVPQGNGLCFTKFAHTIYYFRRTASCILPLVCVQS